MSLCLNQFFKGDIVLNTGTILHQCNANKLVIKQQFVHSLITESKFAVLYKFFLMVENKETFCSRPERNNNVT